MMKSKHGMKMVNACQSDMETEVLITACQEQAISTKNINTRILNSDKDLNCRLCRSYQETINYIVSGYPSWQKAYLSRHNVVVVHLHWNICKEYNISVDEKWYKYIPAPVIESPYDVTII